MKLPEKIEALRKMSVEQRKAELIAWLKTKPENEEFHFINIHNCVLAQFAKSLVDSDEYDILGGTSDFEIKNSEEWGEYQGIVMINDSDDLSEAKTFGDALNILSK